MTSISSNSKQLKKISRSILFSNYQVFLFATLFFVAIYFGFAVLSSTYCSLLTDNMSQAVKQNVSTTFDLATLLLSLPFALGYISLCARMVKKEKCSFSELIRFYSNKKETKSCFAFLLKKAPEILIKIMLPFVVVAIAYILLPSLLGKLESIGFTTAANIISNTFFLWEILAVIIVFLLSGSTILSFIGFCAGEEIVFSAKDKWNFFKLRLSFIPIYILSVLTFGVLFPAYTLPYTLVTYSVFALKSKGNVHSIEESEVYRTTTIFDKVNPEEYL